MRQFVFDITGTCGPCCKGNLSAWIEEGDHCGAFTLQSFDLSADYKQLIVTIEEDEPEREAAVQAYLIEALAQSKVYGLQPKQVLFRHVLYAVLGLSSGLLILITSMLVGSIPFPIMLIMALVSVTLTLVLGFDSFRNAKTNFDLKKPGMDSLFAVSTATALCVSVLALFIPGLPTMFEASLLIFGFRHMGIAIKESMHTKLASQTQYEHLVSNQRFKKRSHSGYQEVAYMDVYPGDELLIDAGEWIPLDGWLLPSVHRYELDVSMVEGSDQSRLFSHDEAVYAGMKALTPCVMRVGLGTPITFYAQKPIKVCPTDHMQLYAEHEHIMVRTRSRAVALQASDLLDIRGADHWPLVLNALKCNTMDHLPLASRQQLLRGLLNYAGAQRWTQTSSYLKKSNQEQQQATLKKAPIQEKTDALLHYFVPAIIGIALGTGVMMAFFFPTILALRCAIEILVSACPCTLGLIIPWVLKLAKEKSAEQGVLFHDFAEMEHLSAVDTVVFDFHKTLTMGRQYAVSIEQHDERIEPQMLNTYLALLEKSSKHFVGKAIYAHINGDSLLKDSVAEVTDCVQEPDGISATIDGCSYLLGNSEMIKRRGITLPAGATYLLRQASEGFKTIASITVRDALRSDAVDAIQACKERGLTVHVSTGADEATAQAYAPILNLNGSIYSNRSGVSDYQKLTKASLIKDLQSQGHRVLMVGDGLNDLSALTAADVGMVMSYPLGEDICLQPKNKARIVNGQVMSVVKAIDIAKQAKGSIQQNLCLSLIYNLASVCLTSVLLFGFGIVLHPGIGAALMMIQTCLIIANVYRLSQVRVLKREGLFGHKERQTDAAVTSLNLVPNEGLSV